MGGKKTTFLKIEKERKKSLAEWVEKEGKRQCVDSERKKDGTMQTSG